MPARRITSLTIKDIQKLCFDATVASYRSNPIVSPLRPALSKALAGAALALTFEDGLQLGYQIGAQRVSWQQDGSEWHEEYAECLESTQPGVFLLHHLRTHVNPFEAATLILDTNTRRATLIYDRIGKKSATRDVNRTVHYGWWGEKPAQLHAVTEDLVGKVIDWKFADEAIIHMAYVNIQCCAFVSPAPAALPGWKDYFSTFNPTRYIRITDNLVAMSFYAPYGSGMEVTMLMDLQNMHAVGALFGIDSTDQFCSCTFGARGAYAQLGFIGRYTVE